MRSIGVGLRIIIFLVSFLAVGRGGFLLFALSFEGSQCFQGCWLVWRCFYVFIVGVGLWWDYYLLG